MLLCSPTLRVDLRAGCVLPLWKSEGFSHLIKVRWSSLSRRQNKTKQTNKTNKQKPQIPIPADLPLLLEKREKTKIKPAKTPEQWKRSL
jgi:DNA replication protein DnaD